MPVDTSKLKGLWEKIKDFFKNMSKKLRIILAAALAVILVAIIVTVVLLNGKDPYTVLYQDLTPTEVSEILTWFENNEITDYQVSGTEISVRNEQYASLLAKLAQAGYPKDGTLYGSYWEHAGTMSTTSERATAYLIAQQERLETSIRTFDGVLDATVYITPGEERTYVLEDVETESTASVKVDLRSGYILTDEQADGIRRLVARAWSGLDIDQVEIVDGIGNTYTDTGGNASDAAELQRQLQESNANRIRRDVKQVLDVLYGADNVRVSVGCSVEVNRTYQEATTYRQPDGSYESGGLIGKDLGYFALTRDGYEPVGGVPGTTTNADIPNYMADMAQDVQNGDGVVSSYERDNLVDTFKEQTEVLAPRITDVTVAVTINSSANSAAGLSVAELRSHVATAAQIIGTDEEIAGRVSVLIAPFPTLPQVDEPVETGFFTAENMPLLIIAAVALLLIIIILIVVLSIRRKKRAQEEEDQRIIEEQLGEMGQEGLLSELGLAPAPAVDENGEPLPPTSGADIMDINTERSMELRKAVRQFVQNNPEVAAMMLKNWLRGDDDNG